MVESQLYVGFTKLSHVTELAKTYGVTLRYAPCRAKALTLLVPALIMCAFSTEGKPTKNHDDSLCLSVNTLVS